MADRRRAPDLGRAARVGGARRRARGVQQLAPREGDAALRPHRRAAPPLPDHLPAAQPQHPAAPARAARRSASCATPRRSTRRSSIVGRLVARRAPRGRQGAAPGAGRAADRPPRPGQRAGSGTWPSTRARCTRSTRCQRWPETKRLLGLLVNSSGGAHARNARRLVQASRKQDRRLSAALLAAALAHTPEAAAGARRRPHADGAQALRAGARAAAQLPQGPPPARRAGAAGAAAKARTAVRRQTAEASSGVGRTAPEPGPENAEQSEATRIERNRPSAALSPAAARWTSPASSATRPSSVSTSSAPDVVTPGGHALVRRPSGSARPSSASRCAPGAEHIAGSSARQRVQARPAALQHGSCTGGRRPLAASDVAVSSQLGRNSPRRHVQPDPQHRPALLRPALDQDPRHLAPLDPARRSAT